MKNKVISLTRLALISTIVLSAMCVSCQSTTGGSTGTDIKDTIVELALSDGLAYLQANSKLSASQLSAIEAAIAAVKAGDVNAAVVGLGQEAIHAFFSSLAKTRSGRFSVPANVLAIQQYIGG